MHRTLLGIICLYVYIYTHCIVSYTTYITYIYTLLEDLLQTCDFEKGKLNPSQPNQSREQILDENLEPDSLLNGFAIFRVESLMRLVWLYL